MPNKALVFCHLSSQSPGPCLGRGASAATLNEWQRSLDAHCLSSRELAGWGNKSLQSLHCGCLFIGEEEAGRGSAGLQAAGERVSAALLGKQQVGQPPTLSSTHPPRQTGGEGLWPTFGVLPGRSHTSTLVLHNGLCNRREGVGEHRAGSDLSYSRFTSGL